MARSSLYNSATWKRLRKIKLQLSPLCAHCRLACRTTPARDVHHIVGINQGGEPYDLDNLESLCTPCHSRVTALELAGKETTIKGVDPLTGKPADPRHPFNAKKISQG